MPKYQATAYIRLSYTDDRSSESDSVTNQRKLIENFIERNPDIQIVSEKIDDGYSGIIFDRPAFKEMMQDITDGKINCVIVKDLSRLGREYIETGRYLRRVFPTLLGYLVMKLLLYLKKDLHQLFGKIKLSIY